MEIRPYQRERDLEPLLQIHRDVGWGADSEAHREAGGLFYGNGRTLVGVVDGAVESFASNHDGVLRYLDTDLPLCVVGGVATSHLARRGGLATRLTAEALALDAAENGAAVAVLGVFDHGFYDRLGFGAGPYDHVVAFDPEALRVPVPARAPVRLTLEDADRVHAGRMARPPRHGLIRITEAAQTRADMLMTKDGLGLGFEDPASGALTHHVWLEKEAADDWRVRWMAWREPAQLLELLGVFRGAADQVKRVSLIEPPELCLWDLLDRPWRRQNLTQAAKLAAHTRTAAWWQIRICDLEACVAATRLPIAGPVRFNLALTDPIGAHLTAGTAARWPGIGGTYRVTLGPDSRAEAGDPDPSRPTLRASAATFSRIWLGAHPPGDLALTCPDLDAPPALLGALDEALRLPRPFLGWDI